jgi:hypothetical protein
MYEQAQKDQFAVTLKNSTEKLEKFRLEAERAQNEEFERNKPILLRKVPSNLHQPVSVKQTTATILREDALVRKQREKEEKWLHDVEIGLKDEQEFEEWRKEVKIKGKF